MQVHYLHGFASSPQSSKAAFFADRLSPYGLTLRAPDFNEPDFSTLTVSRMVGQVRAALDEATGAAVLIGSSLGAFVAVQSALERPAQISHLVLLAPALDFGGNRMRDLGDRGLDEWRRTDRLEVFHYAYGRTMPVRYALYEDARRYDALGAKPAMPIQIFQGRHDAAVDAGMVERWARARPNVELHLLDDDHQLHASLEYIWTETSRFLALA